ncbi:hypothetical protein RB195_023267 [Necator americanus]|uniref:Uncharacterized protein n=1 Tax=Necator americanus TaxID=51031 RepID=A0ABR1EIP6_NECAM
MPSSGNEVVGAVSETAQLVLTLCSIFSFIITMLSCACCKKTKFSGSDHRLLHAKIRLSSTMGKNICYRQRRRKEVVHDDCVLEDSLSQGDSHIEEDANVDYEMLLRGLRVCAERASKPRTTNLDRILKTTKELLEGRSTLRLDPSESHIERPIIPTGQAPPRILPSEVRVAIKSMKSDTVSGPDYISADFLWAGGHSLHVILTAHMTS